MLCLLSDINIKIDPLILFLLKPSATSSSNIVSKNPVNSQTDSDSKSLMCDLPDLHKGPLLSKHL